MDVALLGLIHGLLTTTPMFVTAYVCITNDEHVRMENVFVIHAMNKFTFKVLTLKLKE